MVLLDTNILIFAMKDDEKVLSFLKSLPDQGFAISMISRFEVLIGSGKEAMSFAEAESYLDYFHNLDIDKKIVKEAVLLTRKHQGKLKFKDLLIAATAKCHDLQFITADKDFSKISGLNIIHSSPHP